MSAHVSDFAALYALGALDEAERKRIDAHATACHPCAAALAQASHDVAAIAEADAQFEAPGDLEARVFAAFRPDRSAVDRRVFRPRWPLSAAAAIAAALLIGLLPSAYLWQENQAMHVAMLEQSSAIDRIASAPHRTVAFAATDARVMYSPDGSWYCVVIAHARRPMQVVWKHDGVMTTLGTAVPHGDVAMLYLPRSHPMNQLALVQDALVVGQAKLIF